MATSLIPNEATPLIRGTFEATSTNGTAWETLGTFTVSNSDYMPSIVALRAVWHTGKPVGLRLLTGDEQSVIATVESETFPANWIVAACVRTVAVQAKLASATGVKRVEYIIIK